MDVWGDILGPPHDTATRALIFNLKIKEGNDQEMAQSQRNPHSKKS